VTTPFWETDTFHRENGEISFWEIETREYSFSLPLVLPPRVPALVDELRKKLGLFFAINAQARVA